MSGIPGPGLRAAVRPEPNVTIEFKNAELQDALRMLARQSGISIIMGQEIEGTVTANLIDVPFEKALELLLDSAGYDYDRDGKTVIVNSKRLAARVIRLNYTDARKIAALLSSAASLSGTFKALEENTTENVSGSGFCSKLLITAGRGSIDEIISIVKQLDIRPKQVHIEAKIVETALGDDEKLGINWSMAASITGAVAPTTFPFPKGTSDETRYSPSPDQGDARLYIKAPFPEGEFFPYAQSEDFIFGKVSAGEFSALLQMLSSRRNTNLVSSPSITTLDSKPAEILVGSQVPIALYERQKETGVMEITGYDQQNVGISLWVTPHIGEDSLITLEIEPETSSITDFIGQFNERPVTSTRIARTQIIVKSNETAVIGGLIKEVDREINSKVPILGDIPLLGHLFRHKDTKKEKVDLIVFITPRIITD